MSVHNISFPDEIRNMNTFFEKKVSYLQYDTISTPI